MTTTDGTAPTAEHARLAEATGKAEDGLSDANPWYEWGPYLAERAWGTVREDYSANGEAWDYFPHDHARSRAYRWNEDGMAGLSDIGHDLCLSLALWNGVDPILKERMFGLTGPQGNHAEDAKDYWWYLDGLPSHALLRWRYHYPQAPFPYERLVEENARRGKDEPEFELLDTGVFDDGRYWVVEATYAKSSPTEVLARFTVENKGPDEATIHVLPTLWFRNSWRPVGRDDIPTIALAGSGDALEVGDHRLAGYRLEAAAGPDGTAPQALFCDNETNSPRLFDVEGVTPYPKDGIGDHVVHGAATVNPGHRGTKAAFWYRVTVPAGGTAELRLRLHRPVPAAAPAAGTAKARKATKKTATDEPWSAKAFDKVVRRREKEATEFLDAVAPHVTDPEARRVLRQSCAGLVWSKQMYLYNVARWLDGDPAEPVPPEGHREGRNKDWRHLDSFDVLAMPDPWEYPWFAAWDLAFHAVTWAHIDPAFAKYQLVVLLREWFMHPNGALPSYEWSFDDINPPVHPLAALRVFVIDGATDRAFLERVFQKLLLNFTWWLNRQDPDGNNLFGGGFLGLDNISPIDRSHLPDDVRLEQADGTAWMAYYSLSMLVIALVLSEEDEVYDDMVVKFVEQFVDIIDAINRSGLYDPDDGFFYDRILHADGNELPIEVQTLVGAIPILPAVEISLRATDRARKLRKRFARSLKEWQDAGASFAGRIRTVGDKTHALVSIVSPEQLRLTLASLFDESAFLSPHGLRAVSKKLEEPYEVPGIPGATIDYEPAESLTNMYGGNSNWRGPVWFPVNHLVIQALRQYHHFLGDDYLVEYPTGSGEQHHLAHIAQDLSDRLLSIWLPGPDGRRPVWGEYELQQTDPAWNTNLHFFEYFHGDTGKGLGASHQTGWTALIADLLIDPPVRPPSV